MPQDPQLGIDTEHWIVQVIPPAQEAEYDPLHILAKDPAQYEPCYHYQFSLQDSIGSIPKSLKPLSRYSRSPFHPAKGIKTIL